MLDTREKLSPVSIALHWVIGLTMIGMVFFGMWIADLHPADPASKAVKSGYVALHKSIGMLVIVFAGWRLWRRIRIGLPTPVSVYKTWEKHLAKAIHGFLLFATIALPLTGILNSIGNARAILVFGIPVIPQLLTEKYVPLSAFNKGAHDILGKLLLAALAVHIAGALKHHLLDRDGTLKRMLGARVSPVASTLKA